VGTSRGRKSDRSAFLERGSVGEKGASNGRREKGKCRAKRNANGRERKKQKKVAHAWETVSFEGVPTRVGTSGGRRTKRQGVGKSCDPAGGERNRRGKSAAKRDTIFPGNPQAEQRKIRTARVSAGSRREKKVVLGCPLKALPGP